MSLVSMGSRIELAEMLDVPCVLYQNTLLHLKSCRAGPGDVCDPERAFPHVRELAESLSGDNPVQDKVAGLKGAGAYVATVIVTQCLLVPSHRGEPSGVSLRGRAGHTPAGRLTKFHRKPREAGTRA